MMEALSSWVQTVVLLLLFVAFLQLLLPDHPMRDYTRVVLGLVIIAAVLAPVLTLLDASTWEEAAQSALAALETGALDAPGAGPWADADPWIVRGSALAASARGRVQEEVRRRVDAQVRSLVLLIPGIRDAAVTSRWDSGGNLDQVQVDLWWAPQPGWRAAVPAVYGDAAGGSEGNGPEGMRSEVKERVRTVISQFFSLPTWRVDVRWRDGE